MSASQHFMLQCAWDDECDEPNLGIEKETKPFMRNAIRFLRRGQIVELSDVGPTDTLLDYLRLTEGACGTKEGCGEGDCGACTVAIGNSDGRGGVAYRPVSMPAFICSVKLTARRSWPSRTWPVPTELCIRSSRQWWIITAPNAASARQGSSWLFSP